MGGDLKKFWNFPGLRRYVGMDIAKERLRELAKRFNKMRPRHPPVQVRDARVFGVCAVAHACMRVRAVGGGVCVPALVRRSYSGAAVP